MLCGDTSQQRNVTWKRSDLGKIGDDACYPSLPHRIDRTLASRNCSNENSNTLNKRNGSFACKAYAAGTPIKRVRLIRKNSAANLLKRDRNFEWISFHVRRNRATKHKRGFLTVIPPRKNECGPMSFLFMSSSRRKRDPHDVTAIGNIAPRDTGLHHSSSPRGSIPRHTYACIFCCVIPLMS